MERKFASTCAYAVLIAILAAGMVAVATNDNFASAQTCSAQLGTPSLSSQPYYYGGTLQVTVPVSASCSAYVGPLYAIGTAYYNGANVGTGNTALTPSSNGFSGQLTFNIPTSASYNSLQLSASIYSNGSLLTTASTTYNLNYSGYPYSGYYPYYPYYGYYNGYQYPSYSSSPGYSSHTRNSGGNYQHNSGSWQYSGSNSGGSWHYSGDPNYSGNDCSNSSYCYSNGSNNHHHNNSPP